MALLTDGTISRIEDLSAYDSQLLTVANTEGINVTQKLGLARDEIQLEVSGLLARMSGWPASGIGVLTAKNVVVTAPLKMWHTLRALELVYRDAYQSQLNERYAGKRDEFAKMARWAYEKLVQAGLGMVWKPIAEAEPAQLTAAAGGLADGTYYAAVAWTSAAGEEGASSAASQIQVSGSSFTVRAGAAPEIAAGWNVYAGSDKAGLTLQNTTPLAVGAVYQIPDTLTTAGRKAGSGQAPNYTQAVPRVIQRG